MVFSRRIAALPAVVAIPLGIAATGFALTDQSRDAEGATQGRVGQGIAEPDARCGADPARRGRTAASGDRQPRE